LQASDRVAIGRTDVQVSRLGLGGTTLAGEEPFTKPHDRTSADEADRLIEHSLALGVRYFDTAPMYGLGEGERRLGHGLRGRDRSDFVISTKVGRVLTSDVPTGWIFDFNPDAVTRSLRTSCERLGVDHVDIAFIHDPDDHYESALRQSLPALLELRDSGSVQAIGVGMHPWETQLKFAQNGDFDCFLIVGRYTLLNQSALAEFLPLCLERKISVIAGAPFNSGILAVGPLQGVTYNYEEADEQILIRARRLASICERYEVPLKAAALQFILAHPAIASVIPGARSVAEVDENARMISLPINPELWSVLKQEQLLDEETPTPTSG
jgi:D-threo-aldose 1-dehydrogenase